MAEEINDGSAYLMALRRAAAAPDTKTAADQAAGGSRSSAGAEAQFSGAEKRRGPRYKCEGSAQLCEQGCEVRTWAAFTDISLYGCYVEAQATYPVGTVLQMKLEASGFRVETKGTVRVNYPYLGMGIAFADMTDDNRARLKELLNSSSHPSAIMGPGVVSALPTAGPMEPVPPVSNPEAVVQKLVEFFESRQMLLRDDFLKILRTSESPKTT